MNVAQTNLQLYAQCAALASAEQDRIRSAYELATLLFAGHFRGSGKPFVCHLVGTASVLQRQGAPPSVVTAGLLHAVYLQPGLPRVRGGLPSLLRGSMGNEVESLVAAYAQMGEPAPDAGGPLARLLVWIRLADTFDDCLDGAVGLVGAVKRAEILERGAAWVAAGLRLDLAGPADALAAALLEAPEAREAARPPGRDWSYVLEGARRRRALRRFARRGSPRVDDRGGARIP